jgi:hypothetical protein
VRCYPETMTAKSPAPETRVRLTPAQFRELTEVVEGAVPCCTPEEYAEMSPRRREDVRKGFAPDGSPIFWERSTLVETRTARVLARLGLAIPISTHRNITSMRPTQRGRALVAARKAKAA